MKKLTLNWTGAAGLVISYDSKKNRTTLLQDPYYSHPGYNEVTKHIDPMFLPNIDGVLVTHPHFDHVKSLPNLPEHYKKAPLLLDGQYHNKKWARSYENKIDVSKAKRVFPTEDIGIQPIENSHISYDLKLVLQTIPKVIHSEGLNLPKFIKENLLDHPFYKKDTISYILNFNHGPDGGYNLMTLGSCALTPAAKLEARAFGREIDLLCVPVQGRTDIIEHAKKIIEEIGPKAVYLYHHDDFHPGVSKEIDVGPLEEILKTDGKKVYTPSLGEPITILIR